MVLGQPRGGYSREIRREREALAPLITHRSVRRAKAARVAGYILSPFRGSNSRESEEFSFETRVAENDAAKGSANAPELLS